MRRRNGKPWTRFKYIALYFLPTLKLEEEHQRAPFFQLAVFSLRGERFRSLLLSSLPSLSRSCTYFSNKFVRTSRPESVIQMEGGRSAALCDGDCINSGRRKRNCDYVLGLLKGCEVFSFF